MLVGGESLVGHLKVKLVAWMDRLLAGPWDEEYFELRCRIGRVHVRIGLPQHYMFGAMNVLRDELNVRRAEDLSRRSRDHAPDPDARSARSSTSSWPSCCTPTVEDLEADNARSRAAGDLRPAHRIDRPRAAQSARRHRVVAVHPATSASASDDARPKKHVARIGDQVQLANGIVSALLDMIRDKPLARESVQLAVTIASALSSLHDSAVGERALSGLDDLPGHRRRSGAGAAAVLEPPRERAAGHRRRRRGARHRRVRRTARWKWPSRIRGRASMPRRAAACSSRSSRPRRRGSASGWRWSSASPSDMAATSATRRGAGAPASSSPGGASGPCVASSSSTTTSRSPRTWPRSSAMPATGRSRSSPTRARARWSSSPATRFDVMVTDMRMPKMSGAELIREARRVDPGLPVIVVSAFSGDDAADDGGARGRSFGIAQACAHRRRGRAGRAGATQRRRRARRGRRRAGRQPGRGAARARLRDRRRPLATRDGAHEHGLVRGARRSSPAGRR